MLGSLYLLPAEEVLLEEEDENAVEKSPLDGAWYKRKQNLPGESFFYWTVETRNLEAKSIICTS